MFERFTDSARRVFVLAQEEARTLYHAYFGPEHLLLGMMREGEGIAAKALAGAGADYELTRGIIEEGDSHNPPPGAAPFSNSVKSILEKAFRVSMARGSGEIGTEHLLLGLLEQHDDVTTAVFAALGVTEQEIERQVESLVAERSAPANPVIASRLPSAIALIAGDDPAKRLEVLEGVLWGIDHLAEIIHVMKESANRPAAREVLMAPPFSLTQNQATGVLDLSIEAITADRRQQLVEEIEALRLEVDEGPT